MISLNKIVLLLSMLTASISAFAVGGTATASATGNWNAAATWTNTNINRTGTVSASTGSAIVTGTGTLFLTEVSVGSVIASQTGTAIGTVTSIQSNTQLTLTANSSNNVSAGSAYRTTDGTPAPDDAVVISTNITVTVTVSATCASVTYNAATTAATLTVNTGIVLTVSGAITVNSLINASVGTRTLGGLGTVNSGSIVIGTDPTSTTANTYTTILTSSVTTLNVTGNISIFSYIGSSATRINNASMNISAGTANVDGQIAATNENTANASGFSLGSSTSVLNISNATTFPTVATGSFTKTLTTGSTVEYDGASQAVLTTTYGNIIFSGSGTKTISGNITVDGNWTNNGTTISAASNTITLTGATGTINGTSATDFANLIIDVGSAYTMNNDNNCSTLTIGATTNATATSLTHASRKLLTVSGAVTINQPSTSNITNAWNINAGKATVSGLITFAGSNTTTTRIGKIVMTTGTLNADGGITFTSAAAACHVIDMSGGADTLNLKGAFTGVAAGGTVTPGTLGSIFNYYDDTNAQTINLSVTGGTSGAIYQNLRINNTSSSGATLGAAITSTNVTNSIIVGDSTGSIFNTNGLAVTLLAAKTLTIASGSTMNAGVTSITWSASNAANGININGKLQTTISGGVSGAGITFAINTTNISTASNLVLGSASTIEYSNAGNQSVTARSDYANLTFSGSGTKTILGTTSVSGDWTIGSGTTATFSGTTPTLNVTGDITGTGSLNTAATSGSAIINIKGDWTHTGTFTANTSTVNFNGTSASQSFTPASSRSFNIVKINNTNGVNLGVATTIATLTIADVTSSSQFNDNGFQITGGSGALTINNSGIFKLGATSATTMPVYSSYSILSGIVEYTASATQTVSGTPSYGTLKISGSGTKNAGAGISIGTQLNIASGSTLDMLTNALTGASLTTTGTGTLKTASTTNPAIPATRTWTMKVWYNSSSTQYVPAATFADFTIENGLLKYMRGNVSVSGTLTLTSSSLALIDNVGTPTNSYTLTFTGASAAISRTGGDLKADSPDEINFPTTIVFANTNSLIIPASTFKNDAVNNLTVSGGATISLDPATTSLNISRVLTTTTTSSYLAINGSILSLTGTVSCATGTGLKGSVSSTLTVGSGSTAINLGTLRFDQSVKGSSNAIYNFTILTTGGGSMTLGDTMHMINTFTPPTSGSFVFTSNGNLLIGSRSTYIGRIAKVNAGFSFTGDVVVERYVRAKTDQRRYIFLGSPVDTISIRDAWQDDIFITGPGSGGVQCGSTPGNADRYNSNGFDATNLNLYTIYTYSQTLGWVGVGTNTTTTKLNKGIGYRVLYRGSRGVGDANCQGQIYSNTPDKPDSAIMNVKGVVTTGNVTVPVATACCSATAGAYTLVSNPYPSEIDWAIFQSANSSVISGTYYLHDPNSSSLSGYLCFNNGTITGSGGSSQNTSGVNNSGVITGDPSGTGWRIASGQAFLVRTNPNTSGSITFTESHKTSQRQLGALRTTTALDPNNKIRVSFTQQDSTYLDDMVIRFSDDPTVTKSPSDFWDAVTISSGTFIAGIKNTSSFAIQTRPLNFYNDTVLVRIVSATTGSFRLVFKEYQDFTTAAQIILLDLFTGSVTDVKANPYYDFTVTSNSASQGGRFKLVFRSLPSVMPISFLNISATQKQQGAEVTWKVAFEQNVTDYAVERSDNGREFTAIGTVASKGHSNTAVEYSFIDGKPINGNAYYRVRSNEASGQTKYSAVVKINSSKETLLSIYPNPVKDQLKLTIGSAQSFDKASVTIRNAEGRTVLQQSLTGNSSNYALDVSNLPPGMYFITITNLKGDRLMEKFIKY